MRLVDLIPDVDVLCLNLIVAFALREGATHRTFSDRDQTAPHMP